MACLIVTIALLGATAVGGRTSSDLSPGGRVTLTNASIRELIRDAYQLHEVQIVGGPADLLLQSRCW